ncbi:S9 family peptidase [Rhodanobacter sp. PCA2]|uniref:S9 family peptidase n=1 Tax=Rhodanobacter sp. PCA2 TaxID=2006117 RepID=UPI001C639D32|nr:S9 family peptidase [Rhodanobacter sp. PCA2]
MKLQIMERLRAAEAAGNWVARSACWTGEAGSLVGTALRGEDLDAWEDDFGLPKWLAVAIDHVLIAAPSIEDGVRRGIEIMAALPVGVDLQRAASRIVLDFLDGKQFGAAAVVTDARLRQVIHEVAALHQQRLKGDAVAPAQWRQARRNTTAFAETTGLTEYDAEVALCVEAAAWDPATSRTLVTDTFHRWAMAMMAAMKARNEWKGPDRDRMQALLSQVYGEAKAEAGDSGARIDVFAELRRRHPDEWSILKSHIDLDHAQTRERTIESWLELGNILESAVREPCEGAPPLIPRAHLFANPARAGIAISPDGQWLAWLSNASGVMNIWAAPAHAPGDARQLTFDRHRGLQGFSWTYVPGLLLYSQDRDGDENWRLFGVDASNGIARELSPSAPGVRTSIQGISRVRRDEALVTINQRDPRYPDLYLLDLKSGALTLLEQNPGFSGYMADEEFSVRLAGRSMPDGGSELLCRNADGEWEEWISLSPDDARNSGPTHFSADGKTLYFRDSRGCDKAALTAINIESGHLTVLATDAKADIGDVLSDRVDYRPLAYGVLYDRYRLHVIDESIRADIDYLDAQDIGEWHRGSRTEDDMFWVINASSDIRPNAAYLYDRSNRALTKLLDLRPELAGAPLARMQSAVIPARDGLELVSYVTLPVGQEEGELQSRCPLPLVLIVHGGPWARDSFGYNTMHQWLANRGYAVMSVNFRGSTGFGKSFAVAADGEWGRKMDEDLEDAVQWAIDRGLADPARLAIFGGSYGGYAVLSALTRYPERYACGIDVVGPSNLETLLASIPPYWEAARAAQYRAIGNPETEAGRALLHDRSPLHRAASVRSPLLIAQGANDPRVKQAEAEQMVAALKRNDIPVTYALYSDEGHGFIREANRMSFNALCESFLARHLGGREEPWSPEDFPGTSLKIVEDDERRAA